MSDNENQENRQLQPGESNGDQTAPSTPCVRSLVKKFDNRIPSSPIAVEDSTSRNQLMHPRVSHLLQELDCSASNSRTGVNRLPEAKKAKFKKNKPDRRDGQDDQTAPSAEAQSTPLSTTRHEEPPRSLSVTERVLKFEQSGKSTPPKADKKEPKTQKKEEKSSKPKVELKEPQLEQSGKSTPDKTEPQTPKKENLTSSKKVKGESFSLLKPLSREVSPKTEKKEEKSKPKVEQLEQSGRPISCVDHTKTLTEKKENLRTSKKVTKHGFSLLKPFSETEKKKDMPTLKVEKTATSSAMEELLRPQVLPTTSPSVNRQVVKINKTNLPFGVTVEVVNQNQSGNQACATRDNNRASTPLRDLSKPSTSRNVPTEEVIEEEAHSQEEVDEVEAANTTTIPKKGTACGFSSLKPFGRSASSYQIEKKEENLTLEVEQTATTSAMASQSSQVLPTALSFMRRPSSKRRNAIVKIDNSTLVDLYLSDIFETTEEEERSWWMRLTISEQTLPRIEVTREFWNACLAHLVEFEPINNLFAQLSAGPTIVQRQLNAVLARLLELQQNISRFELDNEIIGTGLIAVLVILVTFLLGNFPILVAGLLVLVQLTFNRQNASRLRRRNAMGNLQQSTQDTIKLSPDQELEEEQINETHSIGNGGQQLSSDDVTDGGQELFEKDSIENGGQQLSSDDVTDGGQELFEKDSIENGGHQLGIMLPGTQKTTNQTSDQELEEEQINETRYASSEFNLTFSDATRSRTRTPSLICSQHLSSSLWDISALDSLNGENGCTAAADVPNNEDPDSSDSSDSNEDKDGEETDDVKTKKTRNDSSTESSDSSVKDETENNPESSDQDDLQTAESDGENYNASLTEDEKRSIERKMIYVNEQTERAVAVAKNSQWPKDENEQQYRESLPIDEMDILIPSDPESLPIDEMDILNPSDPSDDQEEQGENYNSDQDEQGEDYKEFTRTIEEFKPMGHITNFQVQVENYYKEFTRTIEEFKPMGHITNFQVQVKKCNFQVQVKKCVKRKRLLPGLWINHDRRITLEQSIAALKKRVIRDGRVIREQMRVIRDGLGLEFNVSTTKNKHFTCHTTIVIVANCKILVRVISHRYNNVVEERSSLLQQQTNDETTEIEKEFSTTNFDEAYGDNFEQEDTVSCIEDYAHSNQFQIFESSSSNETNRITSDEEKEEESNQPESNSDEDANENSESNGSQDKQHGHTDENQIGSQPQSQNQASALPNGLIQESPQDLDNPEGIQNQDQNQHCGEVIEESGSGRLNELNELKDEVRLLKLEVWRLKEENLELMIGRELIISRRPYIQKLEEYAENSNKELKIVKELTLANQELELTLANQASQIQKLEVAAQGMTNYLDEMIAAVDEDPNSLLNNYLDKMIDLVKEVRKARSQMTNKLMII